MDIEYLADHQEVIPTLAQWFHDEWGYIHPGRTLAEVKQRVAQFVHKDRIPMTLLAFEGEKLLGTVCLREHDMDTRLELRPWLASLYVAGGSRGKGIGTSLVAAAEHKAAVLGINRLYLCTPESEAFYSKRGWERKEKTVYHGTHITIMQKCMVC